MGKQPDGTAVKPPTESVFERLSTRQHFDVLGRRRVTTCRQGAVVRWKSRPVVGTDAAPPCLAAE